MTLETTLERPSVVEDIEDHRRAMETNFRTDGSFLRVPSAPALTLRLRQDGIKE